MQICTFINLNNECVPSMDLIAMSSSCPPSCFERLPSNLRHAPSTWLCVLRSKKTTSCFPEHQCFHQRIGGRWLAGLRSYRQPTELGLQSHQSSYHYHLWPMRKGISMCPNLYARAQRGDISALTYLATLDARRIRLRHLGLGHLDFVFVGFCVKT